MPTFEEALAALAQEINALTGRPMRGMDYAQRTAPTPQSVPGPTGGPELRSYQPSPGEDIAAIARQFIGGQTGDRVAPVVRGVMDYGPAPAKIATDVAMQPVRAGEAVAKAVEQPSLGTVTNAGAQTAMALAQPVKAAGIVAGGLGLAGADQLGLNPIGDATAEPGQSQTDVLTPDQRAEYDGAVKALKAGRYRTAADRRSIEAVRDRYEAIMTEAAVAGVRNKGAEEAAKAAAEQREYDAAVQKADAALAEAKSRDIRFGDTPVGQVYNEVGGVLPFAAAFGGGALSRLGTGGGTFMKDYGLPILAGTGASFSAQNAPLFADMNAPALNPEKEGYQAYARELPPTHPRKQEYANYAKGLKDKNPVRKQAYDSFFNDAWKRLGVAAIEGATFGKLGAALVNSIPRIAKDAMQRGSSRKTPPPPPPDPGPVKVPPDQGGPNGSGGPTKPTRTKAPGGEEGRKGQQSASSSSNPWDYQKRGKDGRFKKGFSFKPRGESAAPSAASIADIGKSAMKNQPK